MSARGKRFAYPPYPPLRSPARNARELVPFQVRVVAAFRERKYFLGGQQRTQFTKTRFKDHLFIIIIDRVGDERKKERKKTKMKQKKEEDIYLELMK